MKKPEQAHCALTGDAATNPVGHSLIAYRMPGRRTYSRIVPAAADRDWMDFDTKGWANRCLPLRIANQAGWMILNDCDFEAQWDGKSALSGVRVTATAGSGVSNVNSMFGYGVLTWTIPYIFQTPPGFNLLVRGPSNSPKDGIVALDAVVETDWLPYPFTMNWRFTRPQKKVSFKKDEPICLILPVRREDPESFSPEIRNLESQPELFNMYQTWHQKRLAAQKTLREDRAAVTQAVKTQGHYIRGEDHAGQQAHGHQTKLRIRPFVDVESPIELPPEPAQFGIGERASWMKRLLGRRS